MRSRGSERIRKCARDTSESVLPNRSVQVKVRSAILTVAVEERRNLRRLYFLRSCRHIEFICERAGPPPLTASPRAFDRAAISRRAAAPNYQLSGPDERNSAAGSVAPKGAFENRRCNSGLCLSFLYANSPTDLSIGH